MEHQSAIAYGNRYLNGYLGSDRSGKTGWGKKWDFIIVHESGHEWFANNITTNDIADMWVHEGFTTYSETLFTEYYYGKQAANEYNHGQRMHVQNDKPVIGPYGVNEEGSGDMYDKASNMIHSIRLSLNNDTLFRKLLRGLSKQFYHKNVNTQDVERYINQVTGYNYQKVFDQYLRTIQIPVLEYYFDAAGALHYRYNNCVNGFNLPVWLPDGKKQLRVVPTALWQTIKLPAFQPELLEQLYFFKVKKVTPTS
jgi:aminopeptidase N